MPKLTAVSIAKDVLKLLDECQDQFYIERDRYCTPIEGMVWPAVGEELQLHLKKGMKCRVCAMGALLVAKVLKADDFRWPYMVTRSVVVEHLSTIFTPSQLRLIEVAFEGWDVSNANSGRSDSLPRELTSAKAFFNEYPGARERLKAIMQNIIKNKGIFIP